MNAGLVDDAIPLRIVQFAVMAWGGFGVHAKFEFLPKMFFLRRSYYLVLLVIQQLISPNVVHRDGVH
jgi:hypothetical protein